MRAFTNEPFITLPPKGNQLYVICDIDGVLANCTHRLHHILGETKDWANFDRFTAYDTPIASTILIMNLLAFAGFKIILMTGRGERVYTETRTWLEYHGVPYHELYMRPSGDHRPAWKVKMEALDFWSFQPANTLCIFEDEPQTVTAMRKAGFLVYDPLEWEDGWEQVNEGGDITLATLSSPGRDHNNEEIVPCLLD